MQELIIVNTLILVICFVISEGYWRLKRINNNFYKHNSTYVGREKRECTYGKYRFCNLDRRMLCKHCYLYRKVEKATIEHYQFIQKVFLGSLALEIILFLIDYNNFIQK